MTTQGQVVCFLLGVAAIWVALGTPLDGAGARYLLSAGMLQASLLAFAAPPLLVAGLPGWMVDPLLARPAVRPVARLALGPVAPLAAFNLVFLIYCLPAVYDAGVVNPSLRWFEHAGLLAVGLAGWWPVLNSSHVLARLSEPRQMLYLFLMLVGEMVVFASLIFAAQPLYPPYLAAPRVIGLSPLEDQQLGGAVLKAVALCAVLPVAGSVLYRWVQREGRIDPPVEGRQVVADHYRRQHREALTALRPDMDGRAGAALRVIRPGGAESEPRLSRPSREGGSRMPRRGA